MPSNTVSISFQSDLLKKIDKTAKKEFRSRSEFIREATRMYVEKKAKWNQIFSLGDEIQKKNTIYEDEIIDEIKTIREKTQK